jgi:two-component system sensor histidine kinase YesM
MIVVVLVLPSSLMMHYVTWSLENTIRNELDKKVVQNLARSQSELNSIFEKMVNISTVFLHDAEIQQTFGDTSKLDYYQRFKVFNRIIGNIGMQNLYENLLDHIKITFFDKSGAIYTNWETKGKDYSHLLELEWVKTSQLRKGFVEWNISSAERSGENPGLSQIAHARTIIDPNDFNVVHGTMILSVDQTYLHKVLTSYAYADTDSVFATDEHGELLFYGAKETGIDEFERLAKTINEEEGSDIITIGDRTYLMSYFSVGPAGFMTRMRIRIIYLTDYQQIQQQATLLVKRTNMVSLASIIASLLVAILIASRIASPVRKLSDQMTEFTVGKTPEEHKEIKRRDEIGGIYRSYHHMATDINDLFLRLGEEQELKEFYYHESLKSKISPHFLFNTLNSIRWMAIIRKADNIRESIDALAGILKYSLTVGEEEVVLSRELEVIRNYNHIQNVRFGNRCVLKMTVPPSLEDCMVIKFILQPVVENCFRHAFIPIMQECIIHIEVSDQPDFLIIDIQDNGKGFSEESLKSFRENQAHSGCGGIGLNLIDRRIKASYGAAYGITLLNTGHGAAVRFHLPMRLGEPE